MFNNIGGKIKGFARILCILGIIASLIGAIVIWAMGSNRYPTFLPGLGILVGGVLVSWIGSFFTYGFGELIDQTTKAREALDRLPNK